MNEIRARAGLCAVLGFAAVALGASGAAAQVFYSYPGARPVTDLSPSLGLFAGFGDSRTRLGGFGRFNVSSAADLGIEALYENVDSEGNGEDTGFGGAGMDGKYAIVSATEEMPLDVSLQLGAGFLARSDFLNIRVPLGAIASHDFFYNNGTRRIVPFAGVYLLSDYVKVETGAGDESDTDFDAEIRLGASAEIIPRGSVFAALHTGNGTMFFVGFNASL